MDKYEQAIKRIQYFLGDNQDCACIECGMQEICSRENDGLCPLQLAIQGIDALREKQERENPKPVIYRHEVVWSCPPDCGDSSMDEYGDVPHCPSCDKQLDELSNDKFCPECGYKINWNVHANHEPQQPLDRTICPNCGKAHNASFVEHNGITHCGYCGAGLDKPTLHEYTFLQQG
jgi:hypothetical protein